MSQRPIVKTLLAATVLAVAWLMAEQGPAPDLPARRAAAQAPATRPSVPAGQTWVGAASLGVVPNDRGRATANAAALAGALSQGWHVQLGPGTFYTQTIRVAAGYPFRLSGGIGGYRYDPASLSRLVTLTDAPILEVGGPSVPNGRTVAAARGVQIENLVFASESETAPLGTGVLLRQCENSRITGCTFAALSRGLAVESVEERRNLGLRVESCYAAACDMGFVVKGQGSGQTFGQVHFANCHAEEGEIGFSFENDGVVCVLDSCLAQAQSVVGVDVRRSLVSLENTYLETHTGQELRVREHSLVSARNTMLADVEVDATSRLTGEGFNYVGGVHQITQGRFHLGQRGDAPHPEAWGPPNGPNNRLWFPPQGSGLGVANAGTVAIDALGVKWTCVHPGTTHMPGPDRQLRFAALDGQIRIPLFAATDWGSARATFIPQADFILEQIDLVVTETFQAEQGTPALSVGTGRDVGAWLAARPAAELARGQVFSRKFTRFLPGTSPTQIDQAPDETLVRVHLSGGTFKAGRGLLIVRGYYP